MEKEIIYVSQLGSIAGASYRVVNKRAREYVELLQVRGKRQPYIRSPYFKKQKIFFNLFWRHLFDKYTHDRMRRLRLLPAALDLLMHSRNEPEIKPDKDAKEKYYRFKGQTGDGVTFYVQVKEDIRADKRYLISVFPTK